MVHSRTHRGASLSPNPSLVVIYQNRQATGGKCRNLTRTQTMVYNTSGYDSHIPRIIILAHSMWSFHINHPPIHGQPSKSPGSPDICYSSQKKSIQDYSHCPQLSLWREQSHEKLQEGNSWRTEGVPLQTMPRCLRMSPEVWLWERSHYKGGWMKYDCILSQFKMI